MPDYRLRFLSFFVKQTDRNLLDVSCGEGQFLAYWKWKGLEVTGTELDPSRVEKLNFMGLPCLHANLDKVPLNLPFRDNNYDVVTCTEVIEHVLHPASVVRELCRVARRIVLLTFPVDHSYYSDDHINFWTSLEEVSDQLLKDLGYNYWVSAFITNPKDFEADQASFEVAIFKS